MPPAAIIGSLLEVPLTLRTARFAHSGIVEAPRELGLPQVPMAEFAIRLRAGADTPAGDLATLLGDNLALAGSLD